MDYKVVIGLELHCELKTNSKVFSTAKNDFNDVPNSNIKPLDMAFPGTLPVVNKEAVRKALKMSLALNCKTPDEILFDRKNYYYPDLPKGYQITQTNKPMGIDGHIDILLNGETHTILIHDLHLEEDTASLDHYNEYSLINYNRSGVPLIEIVTEPCIYSADIAVSFLENLRNIIRYCGISEADTKRGQIRCDANISLMKKDAKELGTKVEIKNINSFNNVKEAILYEIKRQSELLDSGRANEIIQETRRYSDTTNTTIRMREKVENLDYKYFVEPNIPKIKISNNLIEELKKEIPVLPNERKKKYIEEYNLNDYDASILIKEKDISDYFEECIELKLDPKISSNWITGSILGYINKYNIEIKDFFIKPDMLKTLIDAVDDNKISSKQAKNIFFKSIEESKDPKEFINSENSMISDESEILNIIKKILTDYSKEVSEYKNGKDNLFQFFVGQVMKETKGKANPITTKKLLLEEIDKI